MKEIRSKAHRIQIWTLTPVFFNAFMIGCTYGWASNAILFFQQGDEVTATTFQCSLIASSSEFGHLIFALPGGFLLDKYGRKKITLGIGLLHFTSWTLLTITSSVSVILVARFLAGIAIALAVSSNVIIGEIASPDNRAQLCSLYQSFAVFGTLSQSILSVLFSSYFILSYFSLALSCLFFLTMYWILETPQYLISIYNILAARTNLEYIRPEYSEKEIDFEFNNMQTYILDEQKEQQQLRWLQFLKSKSIRVPLITAVSINFFIFAMGASVLNSFITVIIPKNDIVPSKYYPLIIQFSPMMIALFSVYYVEKLPRRTLFLIGAGVASLINLCLVVTNFGYIELRSDLCKWIFVLGIFSGMIISTAFVYPMNNTLKSELFPQSVKGFGSSLGATFEALANAILFQLFNLINSHLGQYYFFVTLMVNSFILYVLVYFRLPEARGQYLADLQKRSDESISVQTDYGSIEGQPT